MNCLNCNTITNNPQFCSRSCSATFNNKIPRKRMERQGKCKLCNTQIKKKNVYCKDCLKIHYDRKMFISSSEWNNITIDELSKKSQRSDYRYSIHMKIRDHSRSIYRQSNKPMICNNCKYDIHVEICHIKSVKSFDKNVKISTINDISNLIALCRNCHWEFDHGYLELNGRGGWSRTNAARSF